MHCENIVFTAPNFDEFVDTHWDTAASVIVTNDFHCIYFLTRQTITTES